MSTINAAAGAKRRSGLRPNLAKPTTASNSAIASDASHAGNDSGKAFGPRGTRGPSGARAAPAGRAVVVTVIVVLAPGVTDTGLKVAADSAGNPVTVNVTAIAELPPSGAVVIVNTAEAPATAVRGLVVLVTVKSTMVTVTGPADETKYIVLPANAAEAVRVPAIWFTVVIVHVAAPFAPVRPLQVCAVPPLPSVNTMDTPTTGLPPVVIVSTAERLALLPFVNVIGPL
jgi:hypothetical protein